MTTDRAHSHLGRNVVSSGGQVQIFWRNMLPPSAW